MSKLVSTASIHRSADLYAGSLLGQPWYSTLPLPSIRRGAFSMVVLYCRAEIVEPQAGLMIWAPRHAVFLNPEGGRLEQLVSVAPEDFALSDDPAQPLGPWLTLASRSEDRFLTQFAQTLQLLDDVIPAFVTQQSAGLWPDSISALRKLLQATLASPLRPYHEAISRDFLSWIGMPA